jgi:protease-4
MTIERPQLLRALLILYAVAILIALGSLLPKSRLLRGHAGKTQSGSVAVIHIYGPIRAPMSASAWSEDNDEIVRRLHEISEDDDIKAVLLRINSPGGTVGSVQEIYTEVLKCKAKGKKVVASLGDVAASGGFYIATSADKIISNPGTITGSIGVIMEFGNFESLFQKIGVRLQVVKSGAHKDIGSPARPLTPEERRMLQASIDDAYSQFVDAVAAGRGLARDKVLKLADGRIFTGREAQHAGLVDDLGDSRDAMDILIKLANLNPHPPIVSDSSKSVFSFMKHMSGQAHSGLLDSLGLRSPTVSLQYLLQ